VRWEQNEIFLPGSKTKTYERREIPISAKFRAALERRSLDQLALRLEGVRNPDERAASEWAAMRTAAVFGNEVGEHISSVDTAWTSALRRAGITDLHFHDLRHEAGSRRLEEGWPLHAVSRWLGHKNITTTARYLNADRILLHQLTHGPEWARLLTSSEAVPAAFPTYDDGPRRTLVAHEDEDADESANERGSEVPDYLDFRVVNREGVEPSTNRLRVCCSAN
jgi:hypothetical protein